ncbi:MAG TPA: hypothetical protein VMY34_07810 [Acidimicrobiales bacterium]|nr:hypothetical protein [Acidimicrobiales bacterium]
MSDDRAREALEHLQRAAHELIAAARAALDLADDLVSDPATAADILNGLGGLAAVARLAGFPGFDPGPPAGTPESDPESTDPERSERIPPAARRAPATKVRRIHVS